MLNIPVRPFENAPHDIEAALADCDLFIAIGTSGAVYPAAGFVQVARRSGAHTLEQNLDASDVSGYFHEHRVGPAGQEVPRLVEELLALRPSPAKR